MKQAPRFQDLPAPPAGRHGWPWTEAPEQEDLPGENAPSITIVTPSFNQAAYIEETIRSILLQRYPKLQYIVIDGGSTDGTVDVLQRYSPWIDYWVSERDAGQSEAINKGLARAQGTWRNWINSDDYLLPGALHAIAKAALASSGCGLISGPLITLNTDGSFSPWPALRTDPPVEDAIVNHRTSQPAMFYHAELLSSLDTGLHFAMDYDLWVKLLATRGTKGIAFTDTPLAAFRLHPDSKTCSQQDRFEPDERIILRRLCAALGSSPGFLDLLAPAATDKPFGLKCENLDRLTLERVLTTRYLLGELRSRVRSQGLGGIDSRFLLCLMRRPYDTSEAAAKSFVKHLLDRFRKPN